LFSISPLRSCLVSEKIFNSPSWWEKLNC
jgi:hypothetical protein